MLRASRRGGQIFSRLKPSNFQTLQPCNALPIYPLCFQILAHSSPQRVSHNSFHVNHFRTLFRSTEGVPPTLWAVPPDPLFHFFSFCTRQKLNPFIFNRSRTLCQKHRSVGRGLLLTSHLSSQSTRSLGGIPGSVSTNSALTAAGACPDRVGALVPLLLSTDHGRPTVAHYFPSRTLLPTDNCPLPTAARSSAACCIIPRLSAPERVFG